ncbi:MAG TPA: membrane dipeptidase [Candidatus Limnocylindrales bacterium]|nr:membrane dipeptidase [Candidatus Limnocylindrales bacterium]
MAPAVATAGAVAGAFAARAGGQALVARTERRLNPVAMSPPYVVSSRARDVHARATVVDLHADPLLWGRDLLVRGTRGHVDVPRLVEGNVALTVFGVATKSPRHLNIERNDDRSDDITFLALGRGWPPGTWRSLTARALLMARNLNETAERSAGALTVIRSASELDAFLARRVETPALTGGLLAIEGAHALGEELAGLDAIDAAGFRMVGPAHFFDNAYAGSAHGVEKGGLTALGRELVAQLEGRSMLVDLAHSSAQTIDDVLSLATRPVVASHTGVCGVCENARNLTDDQLRGIAATGGIVGIGFWPTACGGDDVASIARSIAYAVDVAGADHVGLGSDFDGGVAVPFDASGMALVTDALLEEGLDEETIGKVLGGNALRVLRATLPTI